MASKGDRQNELKKKQLCQKYEEKRLKLRSILRDLNASAADKVKAMRELSKLPRNSAKIRLSNRCSITGTVRGYVSKFGISRWVLQEYFKQGYIPNVRRMVR